MWNIKHTNCYGNVNSKESLDLEAGTYYIKISQVAGAYTGVYNVQADFSPF